MRQFEFDVMGMQCVGTSASAEEQEKLLRIISQGGALSLLSNEIKNEDGTSSPMTPLEKVFIMCALRDDMYDRAVAIVTGKSAQKNLIRTPDGVPVTVKSFPSNPHRWILLIAEMVRGNLSSFTELTPTEERDGTSAAGQESL